MPRNFAQFCFNTELKYNNCINFKHLLSFSRKFGLYLHPTSFLHTSWSRTKLRLEVNPDPSGCKTKPKVPPLFDRQRFYNRLSRGCEAQKGPPREEFYKHRPECFTTDESCKATDEASGCKTAAEVLQTTEVSPSSIPILRLTTPVAFILQP